MSRKTVLSDTRLYLLVFTVLLMTVFQIGNSNFLSAKNFLNFKKQLLYGYYVNGHACSHYFWRY